MAAGARRLTMPYLRVSCPELPGEARRRIAERLTDEVNDLFFDPRGGPTREELRERTTVHFVPYREEELFVGARTPGERGRSDITVELSDWSMSVRRQREVAARLTPVVAELFDVPAAHLDAVNLRFHSYPPSDFAVAGRLLSDTIPRLARIAKRWLG